MRGGDAKRRPLGTIVGLVALVLLAAGAYRLLASDPDARDGGAEEERPAIARAPSSSRGPSSPVGAPARSPYERAARSSAPRSSAPTRRALDGGSDPITPAVTTAAAETRDAGRPRRVRVSEPGAAAELPPATPQRIGPTTPELALRRAEGLQRAMERRLATMREELAAARAAGHEGRVARLERFIADLESHRPTIEARVAELRREVGAQ